MEGEDATWAPLDRAFHAALRPLVEAEGPNVVLFSGGVDSGLLAWELRQHAGVSLFTVGVAGSDDLGHAARLAPLVGRPWVGRTLTDPELVGIESTIEPDLAGVAGPRRGIFVALAAAFATAPTGTLVCGQGADELFLGYAHYRGLPPEEASARASSDLEQLQRDDWPRTRRLAGRWRREVVAPFLDPEVVRCVRAFPITAHLPGVLTKPVLRRWAQYRGLPPEFAERPKRAVQYGSGVDRWLRRRHRAPD